MTLAGIMLTHKTSQYNMVDTCSLVKANKLLCWRLLLKQAVSMQGHEIYRKCLKIQPLQETMFAALCDFQGKYEQKSIHPRRSLTTDQRSDSFPI